MVKLLITLVISTFAIAAVAYVLPGVHVNSIEAALVTALVLGVINTFIKPVFALLTFPITVITLGLFTLVINALMVMLTSLVVPGFSVDNFLWALAFGLALSLVNSFLHALTR